MLEHTTYICEYCGEVFDTEEECIQHENKEKSSRQDIRFFRFDKKELTLQEASEKPESVYAIYFSTVEVCDFLADNFELYATEPGFYVWLDLENSWVNVDFWLNELQEYKKALEKANAN